MVLAVFLLVLSGCSGPDEDSTVPLDSSTATIAVEEELWVDMGEVSTSVGDNWFLVGEPDPEVLAETEQVHERSLACNLGLTECGDRLYWGFEAVAPGETTLVFQYCLQTGLDDCEGGTGIEAPEPVELTVAVTE
ncbi:hypothetical protein GCM10029992_61150 [Glycomyces albus]